MFTVSALMAVKPPSRVYVFSFKQDEVLWGAENTSGSPGVARAVAVLPCGTHALGLDELAPKAPGENGAGTLGYGRF